MLRKRICLRVIKKVGFGTTIMKFFSSYPNHTQTGAMYEVVTGIPKVKECTYFLIVHCCEILVMCDNTISHIKMLCSCNTIQYHNTTSFHDKRNILIVRVGDILTCCSIES